MAQRYQLAQVNIGRARAAMEDPVMADFAARLDDVNALAEASPGFVWRLQTEAGNATSLRPYDDERIMVNLSLWETPEALRAFVYRSAHTEVMRRRKEWFESMAGPHMVLWWIPAGIVPTVEEAKHRLDHLAAHGPTVTAFTFKVRYPPPTEQFVGATGRSPARPSGDLPVAPME